MRVIAGRAKGRSLKCREGVETRPTADRFKEVLFDCIQFQVAGSRFLDLFAGSGAIAIEALSRGAKEAVLVEESAEACGIIRENLETCGFKSEAMLLCEKVSPALEKLAVRAEPFDFIFLDPPYHRGLSEETLAAILRLSAGLLHEKSVGIAETAADELLIPPPGWSLFKEKRKKVTALLFFRKDENL